ncbi:alpha/beta hydrolase [Actinophytocola gossypii]|uniref:Alpha/beta hydrolase n=1 Tax=Actinophytocola gossypii TaxID=2812003 RepID=A0ABT2JGC1_9PSEU|nr:alpha/beta hydrolase [Actinophytocola gossypii]MCT2586927.1 alpha/beta hydrolase [Actinophytocola gossypii]
MPIPLGYLVTVGVVATATYCALVAPTRPRFLWPLTFRLGLLAGELPFLVGYLLAASTALAFAEGDIAGPAGWAGAAVAVVTVLGLAEVVRRSLASGTRGLPWARILFAPFAVRRRGVTRAANLRYGPHGRRNLLDVYRPARPTGPTLVHFHGGGYFSGRKNREARALLYHLAAQGWVCVSANYRLRPGTTFPGHLVDAKQAIAWVREQGIAKGPVVVAGSSAGGHLATLCALTADDPRYQPGFERADTSVAAAVSLYGYHGRYYGDVEDSSPLDHLRPDAPPILLAHGDRDALVPVADARDLAARLRATSANRVDYLELPGAHHCFDLFLTYHLATLIPRIEEFLRDTVPAAEPRNVKA